jgi:cytochrome c biogenesis protein
MTEELAHRLGPGLVSVFNALQLFDLYHSIWFFLLMGLLTANLAACTWARFPATLKLLRRSDASQPGSAFNDPALVEKVKLDGSPDELAKKVESVLGSLKFGKVQASGNIVYGEKGAFSHFGVYFIHFSVVLIIAGAVAGSLLGFDGFANIPVGGSADTVTLKNGKGMRALGFSIRCDDFKAEFYDGGAPKEFKSEITLLKNGAAVLSGPLTVNNPIEYEGVRIFQASYGEDAAEALITVKSPSGSRQVTARLGESFELPGNINPAYVIRVESDLMRMGPAVKLSVDSPDGEVQLWVFRNIDAIKKNHPGIFEMAPVFDPGRLRPYNFRLEGVNARQFTGLQVNSDPGLPLVATGAAIMVFGFLVVFLFSRRQVWVKIDMREGRRALISIAGRSSRDQAGLERELKKVLGSLQPGEDGGGTGGEK